MNLELELGELKGMLRGILANQNQTHRKIDAIDTALSVRLNRHEDYDTERFDRISGSLVKLQTRIAIFGGGLAALAWVAKLIM